MKRASWYLARLMGTLAYCCAIALPACKKQVSIGGEDAIHQDGGSDGEPADTDSPMEKDCTDPTWAAMHTGYDVSFKDVWAAASDDVYAVTGEGVILHYDGLRWSTVHTGDSRQSVLLGVSGRSTSDICAVGAYRDADETPHALIYRFGGSTWQELAVDAEVFLWDVWPAGADTYIVGGPDDTLAAVHY